MRLFIWIQCPPGGILVLPTPRAQRPHRLDPSPDRPDLAAGATVCYRLHELLAEVGPTIPGVRPREMLRFSSLLDRISAVEESSPGTGRPIP